MEYQELVRERCSCRNYKSDAVPFEKIQAMLEAAHYAPSAGNIQPWYYYVITDRKKIQSLQGSLYDLDWISKVPVMIIACTCQRASFERYGSRGTKVYSLMDAAASIENLLLCAADQGLGTCWIGDFSEEACNGIVDRVKYAPLAVITVGYPANAQQVHARKKNIADICEIIGQEDTLAEEEEKQGMEFCHCDMTGTKFEDVDLYKCRINNVNLADTVIRNCNLNNLQICDCLTDGMIINGKPL